MTKGIGTMERNKVLIEIEKYLKASRFINGPISLNLSFVDDLGMDSLDVFDLVGYLEKKFRLRMLDADLVRYKTVLDLVVAITKEIERKKLKAFPPKGNGNYYLADNYNQCEKLKCSVWMQHNKQKTK